MKTHLRITRVIGALVFSALTVSYVAASPVSYTGSFTSDDQVQLFNFSLASPSDVTLETLSFGGGTNGNGQVIPQGGFEPVLSLFSDAGAFLSASGANGSCPPQTVDSATGLCGDAFLMQPGLTAGKYTVALTEFFNVANGPTLADGFLESGAGNFTGDNCGVSGGSFLDETCGQRTANYALDLTTSPSTSAIPEPASVWLIVPATALIFFARLKLRRA
jgi:hypothetical protein